LISQAGGRTAYDADRGHFRIDALPAGVLAAGLLSGEGKAAELSGTLAGLRAAHALELGDERSRARAAELEGSLLLDETDAAVPPAAAGAGRGKCFSCFCEDVTSKDIALSVKEGYDSIELSKRYTTVTMGPCQGRMCQLSSIRLMGQQTGQSLAAVGSTTARPPWVSVPLGALAGRPFEPTKRSAVHAKHRELGARIMWAGDWRRAYDYGDPQAEALAVHDGAGLIDVSTLGKLIVRGPEAGAFLDRLYPNRLSNLAPGRIRYGVLTSEAGRITDDGTVCRLDDETFYVTTTSSGAGAVEQWFSWWLADWQMDVQVTDVTQGLCALNLAGPRAREILATLTELDCSRDAFKYLDSRQARVAGVPCLILRIGFVGELGYEIHLPAAYGEHLWDAILAAGEQGGGIRPFGLEPQRILRLQKMHILVGQDTDSESTPYGAAMSWAVKLDKDDFIGKWALAHVADHPAETALVGFTLADGVVPTEGAAILDRGGAVAGQVTSARYSSKLGRVIGMAWVPAGLASDGAHVTISDDGRRLQAAVVTKPFHDPEGELLRS
jgi:sarcosine oxidase subunit alpha